MSEEDIDFDFFDSPGRETPGDAVGNHGTDNHNNNNHNTSSIPITFDSNRNTIADSQRGSSDYSSLKDGVQSTGSTTNKKILVEASIPSASVTHDEVSEDSLSDDDYKDNHDDFLNFALRVDEQDSSTSHRDRRSTRKDGKPPLPNSTRQSERQIVNPHYRSKYHKHEMGNDSKNSITSKSHKTYTSKKNREQRRRYSDEELSDSASSSDEEVRFHRRSEKRNSRLKIDLKDLSPPGETSSSESHRSRSISPHWSSGSDRREKEDDCETSRRPTTRLTHRRSSSSGSSISVSSLSDDEGPARSSQAIDSPKMRKTRFADTPDKDRLNLELLLAALLEDDKAKSSSSSRHKTVNRPQPQAGVKANYTFSTDRARRIDQENERLLKNIVAQRASRSNKDGRPTSATSSTGTQKPKAKSKPTINAPMRVTPFSVNRMREQQRIERENLALLKRLNKIKPSADISRDKALTDYHRQMTYYCPELRAGGDMQGSRSKSSMAAGIHGGKKQRPLSAGYNSRPGSSYQMSTQSARPVSATSRPISATRRPTSASNSRRPASAGRVASSSIKNRPEWETGW